MPDKYIAIQIMSNGDCGRECPWFDEDNGWCKLFHTQLVENGLHGECARCTLCKSAIDAPLKHPTVAQWPSLRTPEVEQAIRWAKSLGDWRATLLACYAQTLESQLSATSVANPSTLSQGRIP